MQQHMSIRSPPTCTQPCNSCTLFHPLFLDPFPFLFLPVSSPYRLRFAFLLHSIVLRLGRMMVLLVARPGPYPQGLLRLDLSVLEEANSLINPRFPCSRSPNRGQTLVRPNPTSSRALIPPCQLVENPRKQDGTAIFPRRAFYAMEHTIWPSTLDAAVVVKALKAGKQACRKTTKQCRILLCFNCYMI